MKLTLSGLVGILALNAIGVNAWCVTIYDKPDMSGQKEKYSSSEVNACRPVVHAPTSSVPPNTQSYYASGMKGQTLEFYDNIDCSGKPILSESIPNHDANTTQANGRGLNIQGMKINGEQSWIPENNICECPKGFKCS